jgi:hypothetical protein
MKDEHLNHGHAQIAYVIDEDSQIHHSQNEKWIALGKLLAAYSLLCDNISGAFKHLTGGHPGSTQILVNYLRPAEQAHAALQLLEERSRKRHLYAHTLENLRNALTNAQELSSDDLRISGVDFDYAQCLDRAPEEWSCLNLAQATEELDCKALEYFEAAIALTIAVGGLRLDEERISIYERPGYERPGYERPGCDKPGPSPAPCGNPNWNAASESAANFVKMPIAP